MNTLSVGWCATFLTLFAACSSDDGPATSAEGTGGKAGGTSTGGAHSGGATATGGMTGSGGYDPTLAAQCGIDYTGDDCKGCLAASCCSAIEGCVADTECAAEYSKYQTCIKKPGQVDLPACLSGFTRFTKSDGGTKHQATAACIIGTCQVCGGVSPL